MTSSPTRWVNLDDAREAARRRLPRMIFDFIDGGAGDEVTLRRNRSAFEDVRFCPRVLVDVSEPQLATTVLRTPLSMPIICGPTGMPALAHHDAELATARAALGLGTTFTVSTTSSHPVGEIARGTEGPLWFQLYAWRDRGMTRDILDQAREAGIETLLFTVDTPVAGVRERDLRNGMTIPPRPTPSAVVDLLTHPRWSLGFRRGPGIRLGTIAGLGAAPSTRALGVAGWFSHLFNTNQTWDDLEWIREAWGGALAVKGVMSPADAVLAHQHGADAVVVSNHGGRQLDGLPASLDVLPSVVDAVAGTDLEVLLDGGIRSGADVAKALALGARAVLVGRPWLYGLAAGGQAGVEAVLGLLRAQLTSTLQLLGCPDVQELGRDVLV